MQHGNCQLLVRRRINISIMISCRGSLDVNGPASASVSCKAQEPEIASGLIGSDELVFHGRPVVVS